MVLRRVARRVLLAGTVGTISLTAQQSGGGAATLAQKDAEAIVKSFEAQYVGAYDGKDAKAASALFTEHATQMNEFGGVIQGRDKIAKMLGAAFAVPGKWKTQDTPKSVIVLGSDVIVTQGESRRAQEGSSQKPDISFYTKVLVRQDDQWRIAAVDYSAAPISRYVGPPRPAKPQPTTGDGKQ